MAKIRYHVTEKSQLLAENGIYVFVINGQLNKSEAKKALEKEYGHKVEKIQMLKENKKTSRRGTFTRRPNRKKMIVSFVNKAKIEIN